MRSFNYFPFGLNVASTASTLPKEIAYFRARLQPPNGYKDTTVPRCRIRRCHTATRSPGWAVQNGGVQVGLDYAGFAASGVPAELMGGPDIASVVSCKPRPDLRRVPAAADGFEQAPQSRYHRRLLGPT